MGLSARAHDRVLKVARTIADLAGAAQVSAKHLAESVITAARTATIGANPS